MIYIIGSGPAGTSCAAALLARGRAVTMLDAGIDLEAQRRQSVEQLQRLPPEQWRGDAVAFLKESVAAGPMGMRLKLAYGSDYPFRGLDAVADFQTRGADASFSLAQGGLSSVWGAAMLPYAARDIARWPISLADLAPHYRAALADLSFSAADDNLSEILPLYSDHPAPLAPSRQAAALMADLLARQHALNAAGIHFGAARLAVRAQPCVYCGLCLYGCPHRLIFNSASMLPALMANSNFTYVPDCLVRRLSESAGRVRIEATSRSSANAITFDANRVYLAAGPIASTQILLESLEAFDTPVPLLDSTLFMLPLLRYRSTKNVAGERLHTLAQVFLEIDDPVVSAHLVHAQIYTYNDLYLAALAGKLGPLRALAPLLMGRLLIAQCYLHSDFSTPMQITLGRADGPSGRRLVLEAPPHGGQTTAAVSRVLKKMSAGRKHLRTLPVKPGLQIAPPGRGFHSGGTFPMSSTPQGFASDILGRPRGLERVHVVDSTTFPSIPATTITLSVMANARRIAWRHEDL